MLFILAVLFAIPTYGVSLLLYCAWWFVRNASRRVDIEKIVMLLARDYAESGLGTCIHDLSYESAKHLLLQKSRQYTAFNDNFCQFELLIQHRVYSVNLSREPNGTAAIFRVELSENEAETEEKSTSRQQSELNWEKKLCEWFLDNGNSTSNLTPENIGVQTALYSMIYATADSASVHIPAEIGRMTRLETLSFTDHAVATLPRTIRNLRQLRELLLLRNRLEHLPDEICELKNLTKINLIGNRLRALPQDLGKLVNLRELWLSSNSLHELPSSVTQLNNIQYISLTDNPALRLSKNQCDWLMSLMRKGAEVTLDPTLENEFVVAYADFLTLYAAQQQMPS
ncbi:leucine-rich repeat domain-containing protein [Massilia sp. GER05]|uniref:leucine-rich repeat domain-containing protein n=1 Tax=Massilia sp. GER05 TaxID=3394605 RepID=UPI003F865DDE